MKLQILKKENLIETEIDIRYSNMTQSLNSIIQYIRQQEYLIQGTFDNKLYQIPLNKILYFETVDKRTFIYTQQKIFECKKKLSVIEQDLIKANIIRISKTVLLNISYLACVKPYPNHRLLAELNNKENLIVSRKYISSLRDKIRSAYYE
ncbi:MAG: LytTR family transcriptional regulator DNA-binding domain-containing protein [Lactobacillus sp.]|nr:LytTR family transcriptional regulator DNA-binding domain-containing protein [Lactobacillus sp.]